MGIGEAILYGIVQGLTEFLPISSTAHIRIVPAILGHEDPGAAFTAVIQLGTLAAVLVYFARDLWKAFTAWILSFFGRAEAQEARLGWAIVVGTIPIVILGLLFKDHIEGPYVRSLNVIGWTLIGMGILLAIADRLGQRRKVLADVTVRDGLWVGLWQAVALIPGASRSGSTITGALFGGFDRPTAARFSFLLSVPSILAAGILELWTVREQVLGEQLMPVVVASLVSFVVGYAAIAGLIRYLQTRSTLLFVIYRIVLGIVLLVLVQQGVLDPIEKTTAGEPQAHAVSQKA